MVCKITFEWLCKKTKYGFFRHLWDNKLPRAERKTIYTMNSLKEKLQTQELIWFKGDPKCCKDHFREYITESPEINLMEILGKISAAINLDLKNSEKLWTNQQPEKLRKIQPNPQPEKLRKNRKFWEKSEIFWKRTRN